ncbi:MAG: UbiD family decarboxylase [Alphaproteobacteria bacterium]|nr:UbiD family decarboxylase [Alphaproteobacteria bacterium]
MKKPLSATLANHPIRDLREWLERSEAIGELVTVDKPVDVEEEMSAISYLLAKQKPSPAVMFTAPKGFKKSRYQVKHLWNIYGPSVRRIALSLEEHPDTPTVDLIRRTMEKMKQRIPPVEVPYSDAPVYQNSVSGNEIDLYDLPIPRHWPLDGGNYAGTCDAVITRDPDSGYLNVGTYRMMVQDRNHAGLYLSPGKDARLQITRSWAKGEPLPVVACWGIDPLFMLVGSQSFPKNVSEYEYAGGIKGEAVQLVKATQSDLLFPASAELVVEGIIRPNAMKAEGPFGEFTGYYGKPKALCPLVEITAVHYRNEPVLTNALMADYPSCEQSGFFSILRGAKIWDDLEKLGVPGICGVYSHPAASGGFGMTIISLQQKYAGHAPQALALAAQVPGGAYYTKWIIAVDEDVDPTDIDQVLWAMSSRCNPTDDIDILRNTWSTGLDPTQNPPEVRPYGSKALINACKEHRYIPVFSKRTKLRKSIYDRVSSRWSELGLPGTIPNISTFESELDATEVSSVYHDEKALRSAHDIPSRSKKQGKKSNTKK